MTKDIINIVNEMGRKEEISDATQFQNMHCKSSISDLYAYEVGHDNDDRYASDKDWTDKTKHKDDVKLIYNMNIDDDKLEGIDNMG